MKVSEKGKQIIKHYEQGPGGGPALKPYLCPAKKRTWYWGHVELPGEKFNGTLEEAEQVLDSDLAKYAAQVQKLLFVEVTQDQFDALVCLAFNVGVGKADGIKGDFADSTLLYYVNLSKFQLAAAEFGKWIYSVGKILNGLVKRRKSEAILFSKGEVVLI